MGLVIRTNDIARARTTVRLPINAASAKLGVAVGLGRDRCVCAGVLWDEIRVVARAVTWTLDLDDDSMM